MTDVTLEERVRAFYTDPGNADGPGRQSGEGAGLAYQELMGDTWHHGDRRVEAAGGSAREAARATQRRLTAMAGIRAEDRVLDFGCGPGGATIDMAEATGAYFVGVQPVEDLTRRARDLARTRGLADRASFVTIGEHDYRHMLAWPDGAFDAIIFLESVCHLPDRAAFFRTAYRLLKPGRVLVGQDWIKRPYGAYRTAEQIDQIIAPVCDLIRLAPLGTVDSYADAMSDAGLRIEHAADEFAGEKCWGSTPPQQRDTWLNYDGPSGHLFRDGKKALDAARSAGVFSVAQWAARRPA